MRDLAYLWETNAVSYILIRLLMNYPIRSIEIKRFRGIEHFRIEKFSRINILLGRNNVGKTSILEAIFLLTGMSNSTLPHLINTIREGRPTAMERLNWLFYNGDIHVPILISDAPYRSVQIDPVLGLEDGNGATPIYSVSGVKIKALKLRFSDNGTEGEVSFYEKEGEISLEKSSYKETIVADYLPSNRVKANLFSNIKAVIQGGKKARLVEIIKLFDSNTLNFEMIDNELYIQLSNLTQLVPVSFIGDGLQRFIGIFAAVLNPTNSVVLIDELDNGLHYTVLEQLWKNLIDLSIENDTQLFITTHNEESLSSLATVLEEEEEEPDLTVFSVKMTKKAGLKAYLYPATAVQGAVEKEIEMR